MLGTFFNVLMIMIGSTVGSVFKKGIPDKANHALMTAMGLAVMMLGINTSVTNCQLKCNFLPMKTSDGVFQPKTLRGRLFSCAI